MGEMHPSRRHLAVNEATYRRIPIINFLDFVDTRTFEGRNILSETIGDEPADAAQRAMEL